MAAPQDKESQLDPIALQNTSSVFMTRQREEEFRARLVAVVESSDDAIISKTLDGVILTWNEGAQRIFGYSAHEAIGKPITILIPVDRFDEEAAILEQLKKGQRFGHYETVRIHKDGKLLNVSLSVSPIKDTDGKVVGASKIARDITEAKRMEKALRESEARLRAVVEATPDCVKIVSPDGGLIFMNPAGIEMIEAGTLASVSGACVFNLVAAEHRAQWQEKHARICAGEKLSWQFEIIGLGGTRHWMETHAVPLPMPDGTTGQLAVTREITDRKHAEAEREELLQRERTARSEAERNSLMKDEFLATLSHELRTPLNAILGWSRILRSRNHADDELASGLEVIERNARAQTQLIEDLLDMSRIISGKVRMDVQQVNLQDVIQAAVASIQNSADAREIRMQVVIDPFAGPVRGDPGRLQQCLWNLLSNAIKFTPKGGRIQVSLERVNSHLEVSVADNGQGIHPDFLPHVFERFRQADSSTTRQHGGLGLGLSIVKHLTELHGGKVRAKSAGEGKGVTFSLEFPLVALHPLHANARNEHPGSSAFTIGSMDHPSLEGIVVLAVDDEPDARMLVKRLLEECGAKVIVASSAQEGFELLVSERPDVIISDIGMPTQDGYELMKKIRALPPDQGGKTPAAALTAFARAEDRTRALRAGYQMHAAKPVEPSELTAIVASLTHRH